MKRASPKLSTKMPCSVHEIMRWTQERKAEAEIGTDVNVLTDGSGTQGGWLFNAAIKDQMEVWK